MNRRNPLLFSLLLCASLYAVSCSRLGTVSSDGASTDETPPVPATEPAKSALKKSFFLKHNFGSVREGEILSCRLELENDTEEPIRFKHSQVSCGACVSVKSVPDEILPGEKGAFELEFDTSGRKGETKQQALFWDAEPKTVLAMVDLSAVVQACWSEPDSVSLGNVSASEAVKTRIVVWSAAYPDAAVLSVQPNVPWLKAGPLSEATSDNGTVRPIGLFELEWDGAGTEPGGECEQKSVNSVFPTAESLKSKTTVLTTVRAYHIIWVLSSFLGVGQRGPLQGASLRQFSSQYRLSKWLSLR